MCYVPVSILLCLKEKIVFCGLKCVDFVLDFFNDKKKKNVLLTCTFHFVRDVSKSVCLVFSKFLAVQDFTQRFCSIHFWLFKRVDDRYLVGVDRRGQDSLIVWLVEQCCYLGRLLT